MKIKTKMLLYILATSMLIYIIAVGYITIKSRRLALNQVTNVANAKAKESAKTIKSTIDVYVNICATLAETVEDYQLIPLNHLDTLYHEAQKNILEKHSEFYAVATSFELSAIDTSWTKNFGRRLTGWIRTESGELKFISQRLNLQGDQPGSNYYKMKTSGEPMVVDPEMYSFSGKEEDQYLNSNISVPIMNNGTFIGLAGIDVDLKGFQRIIKKIHPFENSYALLLSNNGTISAHPNDEYLGKPVKELYPDLTEKHNLIENIQDGELFAFNFSNKDHKKFYYSFAPVNIDGVDKPWSVATVVPYNVIRQKANSIFYTALIVGIAGLLILFFVIWTIARNISEPIENITTILKKLAKGHIEESMKTTAKTEDEIGEMTVALNTSIEELNKKADFANSIGEGELDVDFELLSEEDRLGRSLLNMRDSLKKAQEEEEKRKIEDAKRRWVNEGLAKFADILRQNNDNLEQLSYEIIKNLVEYLDANQGGIFVLNDEDKNNPVYELKAAYAYNRRKYLEKQLKPGESLVGTCALEKETIYMTDVPQDYIRITSGLGDSSPDSILIVPLKMEEDVLGVVEIASFNKFENYQIEFVEKVGETIASTLSSVRVNIKTSQLLEKSQQQAEEMSAQEEEMRQNMEELKATQEEAARREEELKNILNAVDTFILKAELSTSGSFESANELLSSSLEYTPDELYGKQINDIVADDDKQKFQKLWNEIKEGNKTQSELSFKKQAGKSLTFIVSFIPLIDNDGKINKILFMAVNKNQQ
jgi:methyl-accepting chemotaxis protein